MTTTYIMVDCPRCEGSGTLDRLAADRYVGCPDCHATGEIEVETEEGGIQHQIDAAYDCDRPDIAATLEAELDALPTDTAEVTTDVDPYADYRDADGNIDTAKIFGVENVENVEKNEEKI